MIALTCVIVGVYNVSVSGGTMLNLNQERFNAVVTEARTKAADSPRCLRAIDKAVDQVETNPYLTYTDGELLALGTTGEVYRANGGCQCHAYAQRQFCWHRILAKLMKRCHEALAAARGRGPRCS